MEINAKMVNTKHLESPLYESLNAQYEIVSLQTNDDNLRSLREKAISLFRAQGFPSIKNEEWRFANVQPIVKTDYEVCADKNATISESNLELAKQLIKKHTHDILPQLKGEEKGAYRLVTINGRIYEDLCFLPSEGLKITSIEDGINERGFQTYFGKISDIEKNPFSSLNTALFSDGIYLETLPNAVVDMPLHIIKVNIAENNAFYQPRNLFILRKGSELNIIETTISNNNNIFINSLTEVAIEEQAHLHHYDIQKDTASFHIIQRIDVAQSIHSNYSNYVFTFPGSSFVRNNLSLYLNDKNIESHLYGLYLTDGKQLVDNHTEVHHKFPNGESNQMYKGILMGDSRAVFNGKIYVYEDAQKTNAFQQSNNVLLSDTATINAKPQLEIFADDVKCSHGTTIGQLNKDAIFYLKSRGIGEAKAKQLMVKAFAFDVAEKIKIPALRAYIEHQIEAHMSAS